MRRASVLSGVATTHPNRRWGDQLSAEGVTLTGFAAEYSRGLTAFAYLVCGDRGRAEDLVQDTFMAMYRRFGEVLPIEAPVAYARRAILNGHVSVARKRITGATVIGAVPDQADEPVDYAEQDAMWRAIATLPDRQRHVLVLRYYVDLSDAEIARTLDCRQGTVRSLAARAFSALREHPELSGKELS
jgi:RNA polymerase sigma-70 factor (sigma-E family)